jgi:hypothetical protein
VAHPCNPNYSGGSDLEDHSSKPAWANSSSDLILKIPNKKKKAGGVAQVVQCLLANLVPPKNPNFLKRKEKEFRIRKVIKIIFLNTIRTRMSYVEDWKGVHSNCTHKMKIFTCPHLPHTTERFDEQSRGNLKTIKQELESNEGLRR